MSFSLEVGASISNIQYNYDLYIKNMLQRNFESYTHILSKSIDVCKFLGKMSEDSYFGNTFEEIAANNENHLFKKCPVAPVILQPFFFYFFIINTYFLIAGHLLYQKLYCGHDLIAGSNI